MLQELDTKNRVVGLKQSRRAIQDGKATKAFIAQDTDSRIRLPLVQLCGEHGVPVEFTETMAELGRACRVEVNTSVAVVLKG